jgi:hypothetical protein
VKPLEDLPTLFGCLMTKGEKYQLELRSLAPLCSVMFCLEKLNCPVLQTGLSGFAQQNRSSIFSLPCISELETYL